MQPFDQAWTLLKQMTLRDQVSPEVVDATGIPTQAGMDAKYGVPNLNMFHQQALDRMHLGEAPVFDGGKSQFSDALAAQREMERRMLAAEQFQADQ